MPRVNRVAKCQRDQGSCGKCEDPIPKGSAYIWWKFFKGGKRTRCDKLTCKPRPSELTNSKMGQIWDAQENVCVVIQGADVPDDIVTAMTDLAEQVRAVGEEYGESADAIEEHFENSPTAEECREKADELDCWADTIEEFACDTDATPPSEDDFKEEKDYEEAQEAWEVELQTDKDNAESIVEDCPV